MRARANLCLGLALVLLTSQVGCGGDPLERTISARTLSRFQAWRAHISSDSDAVTRARVETALQEIRLHSAGERQLTRLSEKPAAGGEEPLDESVRRQVDGRNLREMLQHGFRLRVGRLSREMAGLEEAMSKNALLVTKPGDLESRHHLDGLRARQQSRVEKYREEISSARAELAALEK